MPVPLDGRCLTAGRTLLRALSCFHAQAIRKKMQKMRNQKDLIVKEILSTERVYVANLNVLAGLYLHPLQAALNGPEPLCLQEDVRAIFSNLEGILAFHCSLLESLEQRIAQWTPQQCLGDIFHYLSPYLKLYTSYCNNYELALEAYERCIKEERFGRFIKICSAFPETQNLSFASYLIMPVQRIPRYRLLLEELFNSTDPAHPDYVHLSDALTEIKGVASYINHQMRVFKSFQEIQRIANEVGVQSDTLMHPKRYFIQEGDLKLKRTGSSTKPVHYYLFNDLLVLASSAREWLSNSLRTCDAIISLPGCWTNILREKYESSFVMELVTRVSTYRFLFSNDPNRDEFSTLIESTISSLYTQDPQAQIPPHERKEEGEDTAEPSPISPRERTQRNVYRLRTSAAPPPLPPREAPAPPKKEGSTSKISPMVLWNRTVNSTIFSSGFSGRESSFLARPSVLTGELRVWNRGWEKRYCELSTDGTFSYYKRQKEQVPEGKFILESSRVVSDDQHPDFAFEIIDASSRVLLSTDSRENQFKWVRELTSFCTKPSNK